MTITDIKIQKKMNIIEIMKIIIMKIINHGKENKNKDTNKYSHVHDHKPNENNEKNNHVNNLQDPEITSLIPTNSHCKFKFTKINK